MPIRLAIDAGNFVRDRRGMGRIARSVAHAALRDSAFEVTLLLERSRDATSLREGFAGRRIAVQPAASARRRDAYDLVWYPWNGMRFAASAPTLLTLNDVFAFTEPNPERIARAREQDPIRRGAREATQIVTISNWSKREIVRVLEVDPARIGVIVPAPDAIFFPGADDLFMAAWRYILLVGTREARKNVRVLFEACASAFTEPRDMLAIVGEPSADDEKRLRALGVRHTVVRDPDDDTLRALYRNARAVAVPSTAEGFGLVVAEAMACGAPVLASNASALPEAAGDAGLLLDPTDIGAWRDAIRSVFDDDAVALSLSARGAARFAFASRERPAREYLALFRKMIA